MLLEKLLDLYERGDLEALHRELIENRESLIVNANLLVSHPDFTATCLKILEETKRNSS